MKLRMKKAALIEAVSQVSRAISQKTTIPILTGIKIATESEGLVFTGSNSDLTIEMRIPILQEDGEPQIWLEQEGSIVVPGKIFNEIVRKLPDQQVEWEVNDRFQITIRSGQTEFQLHGLDPEEFPRLPYLQEEQTFSIPADQLRSLIRQTSFAVATNEAKGVFTGVLFKLKKGRLSCIATDSHRLSSHSVEVESPADLELDNVIVPGKSMNEMAKTFVDTTSYVNIVVADNQILVKNHQLAFYSRLLDGRYPDTERVIPKHADLTLVAKTKELLQSVERASLISRDGRDNVIKWTISEGKVEVSSNSQEIGRVTEEVPVQVSGPGLSISFNARYMIEALRSLECEEIRIQFTGAMTPFLISPIDHEDTLHLIVPMRTR